MNKLLIAAAVICGVSVLAAGQCPFDPAVACDRGDPGNRYLYYVRDGCNCSVFWQCEKVKGRIVTHRQECPPCLCFSNDTWVCSDRVAPGPNQVCPTQEAVTEQITHVANSCYRSGNGASGPYTQQYKAVAGDPTSFIWVVSGTDLPMHCPPGTTFDFANLCQCVACQKGQLCAVENPRAFRADFDDQSQLQGVYLDIGSGLITVPGGIVGNAERFNGASDIGIPYFKNNEFREFTLTLWFKRDPNGPSGEQGLIFNGNDAASGCKPATISILSTDTTVSAGILTDGTPGTIVHNSVASLGVYHFVALRYTGSRLDLFVDGIIQSTFASGTTLRTKCSLLVGHSFDASDISHYFTGDMDEIRFYRRPLSDADISRLQSSPGSNP